MRIISTWDFTPQTDLENYLQKFISNPTIFPRDVPKNHLNFVEGVSGILLDRQGQFQVEMYILSPNVRVPKHTHPNLDSYEIAIYGMNFIHSGECILLSTEEFASGNAIYVDHNDSHGGFSSKTGGCFFSVQKWLNGIQPSSALNDWTGDPIGTKHGDLINTN